MMAPMFRASFPIAYRGPKKATSGMKSSTPSARRISLRPCIWFGSTPLTGAPMGCIAPRQTNVLYCRSSLTHKVQVSNGILPYFYSSSSTRRCPLEPTVTTLTLPCDFGFASYPTLIQHLVTCLPFGNPRMSFNESLDALVDPVFLDKVGRDLSTMSVICLGQKNQAH